MNIIKTKCSSNNVTRMRQETKPIKIEKKMPIQNLILELEGVPPPFSKEI
jgi:hypothetical protein